jgi:hypothetical protein
LVGEGRWGEEEEGREEDFEEEENTESIGEWGYRSEGRRVRDSSTGRSHLSTYYSVWDFSDVHPL